MAQSSDSKIFGLGNRGWAMYSSLISLSVVAIGAMSLVKFTNFLHQGMSRIELRGQREDLRQHLRNQVDCAATLNRSNNLSIVTAAPLSCSGPIQLYKKNGGMLTDPNGKFGAWTLKAICTGAGVNVLATKMVGTAYLRDPATNFYLDESNPKAKLFQKDAPLLCSNAANGESGASDPGVKVNETHIFTLCYPLSSFKDSLSYRDVCTPAATIQSYFVKAVNFGYGEQGSGAGSAVDSGGNIESYILTTQRYRSCSIVSEVQPGYWLVKHDFPPFARPAQEVIDSSGQKRWAISYNYLGIVLTLMCTR